MMALERQVSFPRLNESTTHDFRKEFKGSVLEKRLCPKSRWDHWMKSIFDRKPQTLPTTKTEGKIMSLPSEMVLQILKNLDESSLLRLRNVNGRLKNVVDDSRNQKKLFEARNIDRLVISGGPKRSYILRCISYETQCSKSYTLSASQLKKKCSLAFAFRKFKVQMLSVKNLPPGYFNDDLILWLRDQLAYCPSMPIHLSMQNIDFRGSGALTLHHLLAPIGKNLQTFEMEDLSGVSPTTITDAHISQLDLLKIKRIVCDGITMFKKKQILSLGKETLQKLASLENFPTIILYRCNISTQTICDYSEAWLQHRSRLETTPLVRAQLCTVKRCVLMNEKNFEEECTQRGLECRKGSTGSQLKVYNVHDVNERNEFTVAIDSTSEFDGHLQK